MNVPKSIKGTVAGMAIILAMAALPFGMSAANWYLQLIDSHTSRDSNTKIDGEIIEMADGSHVVFQRDEDAFNEEIAKANERYFRFTCTAPPSVIRKGDKVSLTIDNYDFTSVSYQYNMDSGGRVNPPIDETTEYRDFLDSSGDSWSENPIDAGGPETRTVSLVFDDKFVGDMVGGDITEEVPDGTQMAIVYRSPVGETRWTTSIIPTATTEPQAMRKERVKKERSGSASCHTASRSNFPRISVSWTNPRAYGAGYPP